MNNKAHLRPKDYDSNGDIIPMACKEEKGDLISRKWLTDAIRNRRTYLSYEDAKDVIDLIDNAPAVEYTFEEAFQKTVCEQRLYCPAKPQGEWIPVDERLPEALQSVLVTSTSGRVYTSYIVHGEWEYGGNVIAWQPLPEPYKKGGAE